jgi:inhibitor of cysteine peptidase
MSLRLAPLSALAALLLLPACAADEGAAERGGGYAAIPAPLPPGSPRVLTEADDGTAVTLRPGQTIAVTLVGVPTAGYVWAAREVPAFLTEGERLSGPTSEAQNQPGFAGGYHWEVLVFEATRPGSGRLALAQSQPWETDEPPVDTFELDVTVE